MWYVYHILYMWERERENKYQIILLIVVCNSYNKIVHTIYEKNKLACSVCDCFKKGTNQGLEICFRALKFSFIKSRWAEIHNEYDDN